MKKIFTLIAAVALFNGLNAQDARAVPKGKNSVNIYYGYNVFTDIFRSLAKDNAVDLKVKSLGPVGLVYEHMMTDAVGLGVEAGYGSFSLSYDYTDTYYDANNNLVTGVYEDKLTFTTIRAMVRLNIHFVKDENFDCYFLTSAGYRSSKMDFSTTNPNLSYQVTFNNPVNFGLKPGLGVRYFFNGAVGLHAEIALGTPVACAGLSFRF